jgi:5-bromo-4-chloroindolyl phosphate hydrolysis protein
MQEGLRDGLRVGVAVALAAAVGIALYHSTRLHELVVGGAAVAVFAVALFMIPRRREPHEIELAPGVTLADRLAVEREGAEKIARVTQALGEIPARDPAHETVQNILGAVTSIYRHFVEDPADIARAAPFREAHVRKAVDLIETYTRLVTDRLLDERGRQYVDRCRERFAGIEAAFVAQYNAMLSHDVTALETAGRNLEASLRLEHGLETVTLRQRREQGDRA